MAPISRLRRYLATIRAHPPIIVFVSVAIAGCSIFHREPPQQQFFDALSRGHAAEASQIWLKMSVEDRAKFQRGEGITPRTSPEQLEAAILRHQTDDAKPRNAEGGSPTVAQPVGAAGGWLNLPSEALSNPPNPSQTR